MAAKIIIIEDEPIIALDLEDLIREAGFEIAGVATRLDKALTMIEHTNFDAAILDANLHGLSSQAARALTLKRLPFIVLSGCSLKQKKASFPDAHFIQKPCKPDQLISALNLILKPKVELITGPI
jgi:DNA-binding response OmpR family regulator